MTEMTLEQYQVRAESTALPTAHSYDYLIPGILSEVGECYGKFAKAHRDRWAETEPAGKLQQELVKEFGDICWPTAVLLNWNDIHEISEDSAQSARAIVDGIKGHSSGARFAMANVNMVAYQVELSYNRVVYLNDPKEAFLSRVEVLWEVLRLLAPAVTGESFDHVLGVNVAKLQKRKLDGVLEGSGDDR